MDNMPFFSIVIPTYNRAHLISKTLDSVLAQDFQDFEIIIVDDGSTDATELVMQPYLNERVHYYKKTNEERAVARNFGTKKAQGEYICWFDSDDLMYPNHLQSVHENLIKHNLPEAIHTGYHITKPDGSIIYTLKSNNETANKQLIEGNFLSCNSVFLKREVALLNPFNEDRSIIASEDWELWLRIAAQFPIYSISNCTFALINHDERSVINIKKENLLIRFENLIKIIKSNASVVLFLDKKFHCFEAECFSYISLHLALTGKHKKEAFLYFTKSIRKAPHYLLKKRSIAILRRILQ